MKRLLTILFVMLIVVTVGSFSQAAWTQLTTFGLSSFQSRAVEYLPSGVIWVAGGDLPYTGYNYVQISTDHGVTWTKRDVFTNPGLTGIAISNISALDGNTALAGLTTGEILRTTNGGVKWDTVSIAYDANLGFVDGVKFVTPTVAVAFGDADALGTYVGRSTDAGATWTRVSNLPDSSKRDTWFAGYVTYGQAMDVYNNTIWMPQYYGSGKRPWMLKSTDAGATWEEFPFALPGGEGSDYYLRSINFKDDSIGFGVIRQVSTSSTANYLVKTTDGGRTWSDTVSVAPGSAHADAKVTGAKWVRGTNTVVAVGWGGSGSTSVSKAWMSTDDGANWTALNPPNTLGSDLKNCSFISATRGMAVGYTNAVLYAPTTDVDDAAVAPLTYSLSQNYPNPFNPSTTISYALRTSGHVVLKVHDLLGRTVATLVNGVESAGQHSVSFDASSLTSGVYVYTIQTENFRSARTMVLMK